jgi:uncharacterized membrane protein YedE/YeeE
MFWEGSVMKVLTSLLAGLVFGLGIAISGMMNPAKVLNFFDIAGSFDPSLIFVMGGALITTAVGYRFVFGKLPAPVFAAEFAVPKRRIIDAPLVLGSAAFGVGWGISGFCPGGVVPALGLFDSRAFLFVAAMCAGLMAARAIRGSMAQPAKA